MRESYVIRDSHSIYKTVNYHYKSMPCKVDYSTKAQVKAWIYGGDLPRSVLSYEALIDEVNEKIKQRSKEPLICEIRDDGEIGYPQAYDDDYIDRELEKALDIQLGNYQNEKK